MILRRVVGVEAPAAMFRRRGWHSGPFLIALAVTRVGGGDVVVVVVAAADNGAEGAVAVADVQGRERRRRGWQLLGGGAGGTAGRSLRRVTAAAWCWRLANDEDTFPVTDVALGHRVQLVPGNPTGARPTHSNPR